MTPLATPMPYDNYSTLVNFSSQLKPMQTENDSYK